MMTEPNPAGAMRHEVKHQITLPEDLVLSGRLRRLFPHDAHAGANGSYTVTSLYFDTPYDDALRDKLNGVDRREKFRLRYYGENPGWLKLEKKYKVNGLCGKRAARLTRAEGEKLLAGDFSFLAAREEPLLAAFYHRLRRGLSPKTVVCYDREAFLYAPGNVRLTLDRRLRTGPGPADFFRPARLVLRPMAELTVLEVKWDAFLPDLVRMAVQVPGRQGAACSKYALCRRFD